MKSIFLAVLSLFILVGQAGAETATSPKTETVLYVGQTETTEINVGAMREAADLLRGTRPDLSDEILKAADIVAK